MADITMCSGAGCKIKESCYRFTAPKKEFWQAYFTVIPPIKDKECAYYWDNKLKKTK